MGISFGTATPTDYKFGNNAVSKVYLGTIQVWPTTVAAKLVMSRDNGSITTWTGDGTSLANAFYRGSYTGTGGNYYEGTEGLSHYKWTLSASGTVYISCTTVEGTDGGGVFYLLKNNSPFATSAPGGGSLSGSVSGVVNDYFTIAPQFVGSGYATTQEIYNVSVYAT